MDFVFGCIVASVCMCIGQTKERIVNKPPGSTLCNRLLSAIQSRIIDGIFLTERPRKETPEDAVPVHFYGRIEKYVNQMTGLEQYNVGCSMHRLPKLPEYKLNTDVVLHSSAFAV